MAKIQTRDVGFVYKFSQYSNISQNEEFFTPIFDADGNQTLIKTSTGIWSAVYNADNRPTSFSQAQGDHNTIIECGYDYTGRRYMKKVTSNGTVSLHQRYIYRGYLQIACVDLTRSGHPALWYITWDPTEPVATRPLAIQKNAIWYTYSHDLTKNVTELYQADGLIATSYDYSPYGAVTAEGIDQPIQWSSEYHDPELALTYYNYRHYNPTDGRWINRDPLGENGGVNMYAFVKNNSITQLDMLGRLPCPEGENVHIRIKPNSNPISHQYRTQKEVKNNPNKPNGCGIEGGVPIPETFPYVDEEGFFYPTPVVKSYSFTQACNNHDTCYGKCNSKQRNCDNQFLVDMIAQCENISNTEANTTCVERAILYHKAVVLAGEKAYQSAQDAACEWEDCCKGK